MSDNVRPVIPTMDPRSLIVFCPGCASTYETTGLAIGAIRCKTCENHGEQLVLEVRRYQDVKANTPKGDFCHLDKDYFCQEPSGCVGCAKQPPAVKIPEPSMCDRALAEATKKTMEETILKANEKVIESIPVPPVQTPMSTAKLTRAEDKLFHAIKTKPGQTAEELRVSLGYTTTISVTALARDLLHKNVIVHMKDGLKYRYYPKED